MPSEKVALYYPTAAIAKNAYVSSMEEYEKLHAKSMRDPAEFWLTIAKEFYWQEQPDAERIFNYNFDIRKGPIFTKWFDGATTNISFNLLDRHVQCGNGDRVAYLWEGNHPNDAKTVTYAELLEQVCRFANTLRRHGVRKGDRVAIYMPMTVELPIAMLACTRIGAIHSIVFAGFSADSLAERLVDSQAAILITADGALRGDKPIYLKEICDHAMTKAAQHNHTVKHCVMVAHVERVTASATLKADILKRARRQAGRDLLWHEEMARSASECEPEWMQAEDPLFMLYTSGSTGKPKGVLHTTAGYMIYAATTFRYVFDYHKGDVYWCTADIGWITGHTYGVYGPLANGATSVMFEGTPFYPQNDRFWAVIEKYRVNQFYTAPTAIRALMKFGDEHVTKHDLSSLRVLGSVGEPINPEAWMWYYKVIGREKCSIVDTFWQTETGGHVLTPLPGATPMKPGSAAFPFFGVDAIILDESGKEIKGEGEGYLVFSQPWPSIMRTLFNNHERYEITYFSKFPGYYCTGDGARRDADGYLWVTGRVDDMLNVSGHLMSTAEVESVLTEHENVAEAAVVSAPHKLKGECLYCFITPKQNAEFTDQLVAELKVLTRERIGPFAQPDVIQHAPALPKTRSGKIMRRILRKIAVDDRDVGDISTLADMGVVEVLFKHKPVKA